MRAIQAAAVTILAVACASCGGSASTTAQTANTTVYLKDAPPVDVRDRQGTVVFRMDQLWLTITEAKLEDVNGHKVRLTLAQSPLTVDILTLSSTSALLAVGSFPAGVYDELELEVTTAVMVGTPAAGGAQQTHNLAHQGGFEAEFALPAALNPGVNATIVIDFVPAVVQETSGTYTLEDQVHGLVLGTPGSGSVQPVDDVEGTVLAVDCGASSFTLGIAGGSIPVDIASAALEDDDGNPITCAQLAVGHEVEVDGAVLGSGVIAASRVKDEDLSGDLEGTISSLDCSARTFVLLRAAGQVTIDISAAQLVDDDGRVIACAQLAVGHDVEVDGTFQPNGTVLSSKVKDEDVRVGGGGGGIGADFEDEGVVANLTRAGAVLGFDLVVAGTTIARVTTDAATEYEDDTGAIANPGPTSIQNGMHVEVEGVISTTGAPPTVGADEVEIQ